MSEFNVEKLSERERACLEHVRQAQELRVSFAEYCRRVELNVNSWYGVRQSLVRQGVIACGRRKVLAKVAEEHAAGFVPVHVAASTASSAVACRLRHPSGWALECATLPEVSWMKALLAGAMP